jgi:O-acetyl-ADP-ribose deacetylase (regulator of RNase III)
VLFCFIIFKADVMVNSCAPDMKLQTRPGLSKTISEAAGSQLQDEINHKYPRGIQVGNLAITGGHAIQCNEMFHGTLTSFFAKKTGGCRPEQVHEYRFNFAYSSTCKCRWHRMVLVY